MTPRSDDKAARREERLIRERDDAERARRRQLIGYAGGAALAVAVIVIVVLVVSSGGNDKPTRSEASAVTKAAAAAGCTVRSFPNEGRGHTSSTVQYHTNPPTSGNHNPVPAPDQIYPKAPPPEYYVHSLEHGRIELQYKPGAPGATVVALRGLFNSDPDKMLMFPNNTGMPYAVAATAWQHLIGCPAYNARVPAALTAFRDAYRGHGPEQIP